MEHLKAFYDSFYSVYEYIIKYTIIAIEMISAGIICFTIVKSLVRLCQHKENVGLEVSEGIALALEFKLGSEVLRTLIVRAMDELLILGSIIVLMAALSVFIQWEIKNLLKNKTPTALKEPGAEKTKQNVESR